MSFHFSWTAVSRPLAAAMLIMISASVLPGCTRQSAASAADTGHTVELSVQPDPASVGPSQLWIEVFSPDGEPIDGAEVSARGDMNHAGMVPVFGEAEQIEPGRYRVPFEWSMAGDWIVTIEAALPSGTQLERTFDIRVRSNGD
ncbi:MAG: FixH family protein [Anaerolineales bacterium]|nr:FixH family protein [Anaerolineales bacterium]